MLGSGAAVGLAVMIKLFAIAAVVPIGLWLAAPLFATALRERDACDCLNSPRSESRCGAPPPNWRCSPLGYSARALVLLPFVGNLGLVYDQVIRFHIAASHAVD